MARARGLSTRLGVVGGQEERRSPRRRIVTYIVLVAGSLLLLAMSSSTQVQEVRQGVRYAVSPIQEVLAGGARGVSSIFAAFTEVDHLRRENRAMASELASLRTQVEQLEVVRVENGRLSELLETRRALDFTTQAAFVVGRTPTTFERTVTLDRGRDVGLQIGDAVLSPGGALAGIVTEVFEGTASVRLLSDPRSLVIGLAVGTRATGEVVGNFSAPLKLEKVAATETLTEGDMVTTAGTLVKGFKALLPRDLLIGNIVQITDDPANFSKSALIQPAADLDRLEAVLVITSYDAPVLPVVGGSPEPEPVASASPEPQPDKTQRPRRNNNRP